MPALPYGLRLEAFGLTVEVRTDDPLLFELAATALPVWSSEAVAPGSVGAPVTFSALGDGTIRMGDEPVTRVTPSPAVVLAVLEVQLRRHLAQCAPRHVFIHAGVVALGGMGVVLPGRSFSGKTTLVAELVKRGATYLSDEYAVVDESGLIHPYARPLRLRPEPGAPELIAVHIPAARIGRGPVRAGLIVVTGYEPGATWNPTSVTAGEGAMALFGHTVPARTRPRQALAAARAVARESLTLTGARGEASSAAADLLAIARTLEPPVIERT